jgi:hypothetical protein
MFKAKKLLFAAVLSLLGMAWPQAARAQFIGDVGLQTVNTVLNGPGGVTCNGIGQSFTVPNVGAISHQAAAISSAAFTMEIDAFDGIATYRISNPPVSFPNVLAGATSYVVQASGYYPKVTVVVTCSPGAAFTLSYAGAQTAFSPLVGQSGSGTPPIPIGGGIAANVQGVVAQQQSAGGVDPIIAGGLAPAVNTNFTAIGLDNSFSGTASIPLHQSGVVSIVQSITPSKSGEFGLTFEANIGVNTGTTSVVAPWVCVPGTPGNCAGAAGNFSLATLSNVAAGTPYQRTWTDAAPGNDDAIAVLSASSSTALRTSAITGPLSVTNFSFVAGDTVLEAFLCSSTTACQVSGISSSGTLAGLTWKQIAAISTPGAQNSGIQLWAATATVPSTGVGSSTATMASGTSAQLALAVLSGTTPASLTTPAVSIAVDPLGAQIVRQDAQAPNQFTCSVTLSTNTTATCQPAPTLINGVAVRNYVTDFQIQTTAAGTSSTVTLVTGTGTNCGTGTANLSSIVYPLVAATINNVLGLRTPFIAPLQSQVCATQGGGTAGTVTVEIHGFLAP